MRWLRHLLFIPPILLGVGLVVLAINQKSPPAREAVNERAIAVPFMTIAAGEFVPKVTGFGSVEPARQWFAVAQVSGRVVELHPEFVRGGTVRAGDLLIRLDPEDYELAVQRALTEISRAQADLSELAVNLANLEGSLALEREQLALDNRDLERQRTLVARGTIGRANLDDQERAVLVQRARVQDLENQIRLMPEQRRQLEQNQALSETDLAEAELDLARTQILAPFSGRVSQTDIEISQYVAAGVTMGMVDGIKTAEIDAQFAGPSMRAFAQTVFAGIAADDDGFDFERLSRVGGLEAVISTNHSGDHVMWDADVVRISDTIDPQTRAVGLIMKVDDPYAFNRPGEQPPLIKGMFVRIELRGRPMDDAIIIPRSTLRDGEIFLVGGDDRLERRVVEVRALMGDVAIIANGLEEGERLITQAPEPAIDGMLLRPVEDALMPSWLAIGVN